MSIRLEKISSLIKNELSLIFLNKIQDPKLGLVTITKVTLTPDLKNAKIYISIFDKEKREEALDKITSIKGMIRSELARRVNLRHVPDLSFYIDDTLDYVEKMDNIFRKIHDDNKEVTD